MVDGRRWVVYLTTSSSVGSSTRLLVRLSISSVVVLSTCVLVDARSSLLDRRVRPRSGGVADSNGPDVGAASGACSGATGAVMSSGASGPRVPKNRSAPFPLRETRLATVNLLSQGHVGFG